MTGRVIHLYWARANCRAHVRTGQVNFLRLIVALLQVPTVNIYVFLFEIGVNPCKNSH